MRSHLYVLSLPSSRSIAKKASAAGKGKKKKEDEEVRHVYVGWKGGGRRADREREKKTTTADDLPLLSLSPPHSQKVSTALFFKWNSQLGPPYQVLVDTNFINFSIKNKVQKKKRRGQKKEGGKGAGAHTFLPPPPPFFHVLSLFFSSHRSTWSRA